MTRVLHYDEQRVYEAISPFHLVDEPVGVLRLGLSLEEYQRLSVDVKNRLYILTAILTVIGFVFANFMISYRHRQLLRRDLNRLHDYTETILDNLQSGVLSLDDEGRIQKANKQALSLLNKDFDSVHQKPLTILPTSFQDAVTNCLQDDRAKVSIQVERLNVKGQERIINIHANLFKDDDGNKTCVLLLDDVTEQRRFEEQVRRNEKLTVLQNLASAVAHEIRNPLNSIRLIIDLLRKKNMPAEDAGAYYRNLVVVGKEISRISAIVEQYLRFGRMPELHMTSIQFPILMEGIIPLFESRLREKNISLHLELQKHPAVKGDVDQLMQVFINLIQNAEEAIETDGEIRIMGTVTDSLYEIRIIDNGKGIPEKDIGAIFDLNFSTKKQGSGIGLAVVQQIIDAHNGHIEVESKDSEGSTFLLGFPLDV